MKHRKWTKALVLLVCCVLAYAVLCLTGLLDKQKIWQGVPVEYMQGKQRLSLDAGDAYATVTGGPYTELPAGVYRLKWQIEHRSPERHQRGGDQPGQL